MIFVKSSSYQEYYGKKTKNAKKVYLDIREDNMKEIKNVEQFNQEISDAKDSILIVDFAASWCKPCVTLTPILKEIDLEGKIKVVKIDVDQVPELAQKYGIRGIPTMLYFKNGVIIKTLVGIHSKEEIEKI